MGYEMLPQIVKGRGTQNMNLCRQTVLFNQFHQRARDGTVCHILFVWPGCHQQNIDLITWEFL